MTAAESPVDATNRHRPTDGHDDFDLTLGVPVEVEAAVGAVVARDHRDRRRPAGGVERELAAERFWVPRLRPAAGGRYGDHY